MSNCDDLYAALVLFWVGSQILGIVILLVLFFSTRRKNLCLDCCGGRPGLYSPVDLLTRGRHRLIYAAFFGLMSDQFLSLTLNGVGVTCYSENPYSEAICNVVLSKILYIISLCLLYGPLFASVSNSIYHPLCGHIGGLIYLTLLMIVSELFTTSRLSGCDGIEYDRAQVAIGALSNLPTYILYLIIAVWFIYEIANDIKIKLTGRGILFNHQKNAYLFRYTRHLLSKSQREPAPTMWRKFLSFFWIYERNFRFPLRFLAPLIVMISIILKLFFYVVELAYQTTSGINVLESFLDLDSNQRDIILIILRAVAACVVIAGLVAIATCAVLLLQMVATVHKHLKLAARGKFKFYSKKLPSHASILVSSLKYGGYQIGYFVWAWFIYLCVGIVVGLILVGVVLALVIFPGTAGPWLFEIFMTVIWLPVVILAHRLMFKFVFLEKESGGKFLAITNRNGFNWFSYFMFLYNALVGFVSAIIRVLFSLLFGTLLLFRLDQNIMMDNFKFADRGNKVYLGFLYLEHTYNNPVANTFVALLTDNLEEGREKFASNGLTTKKQRVRNRWLVAYTLLNNPSIRQYRASTLNHSTDEGKESMKEDHPMNDYENILISIP